MFPRESPPKRASTRSQSRGRNYPGVSGVSGVTKRPLVIRGFHLLDPWDPMGPDPIGVRSGQVSSHSSFQLPPPTSRPTLQLQLPAEGHGMDMGCLEAPVLFHWRRHLPSLPATSLLPYDWAHTRPATCRPSKYSDGASGVSAAAPGLGREKSSWGRLAQTGASGVSAAQPASLATVYLYR